MQIVNSKCVVSIIIPTYNRAQYIGLTIDSFVKQSYDKEKYEIIICDNHSTDYTKEVIFQYIKKYPKIRIVYLYEERQGVHYARNKAARTALGDILYFTDDDMIADSDMLERLIGVFEHYENLGAVTGKVIPKWEQSPPVWVKKYLNNQWLSLIDKNMEICITKYDLGVYSCHEAVKKEVFMKTGGFHPENTAGEWVGDGETGLNMEIADMGYYFGYVGSAVTEHIIPPSRTNQKYLNKRLYNQGCSDSYTAYRMLYEAGKEFKVHSLLYVKKLFFRWMKILLQAARGRTSLRFIPAYFYYYKARLEYDKRLVLDRVWREMVLQKDWLHYDEKRGNESASH